MIRARKRPITLSLDARLIEAGRARGLDLSAITEQALGARIAEEDARHWLAENSEAIAAQNAWTAERGPFSGKFRGW